MLNTDQSSILPSLLALPVPRQLEPALERALGLRRIEALYDTLRQMGDDSPLSERLLQHLQVTVRVSEKDLDQVPRKGPAVLVVNHPFGILEGAVIATLMLRIRRDVKFLANGVLTVIPELRDLLIPVDPLGGTTAARNNPGGVRQSLRFLADGGLLVLFPAGEVAHFQWKERSITDPEWNPAAARILAMAARRSPDLSVIPAFVEGANSALFQVAGLLHPRIRTALLARELLNKHRTRVVIRIGNGISATKLLAIPTDEERIRYLRWRTYLLASRQDYKPATELPLRGRRQRFAPEPVVAPVSPELLARDVLALDPAGLLARSGGLSVYVAGADEIPGVLREIGRLRELTFRAAGEGTGKAFDLDRFDAHYQHLFVWNEVKHEVVGAYRLAGTDQVRSRHGLGGLYTATLFDYGAEFLDRMGPALELGRSFVRAEYQRGFAPLLLLWKGIGKYVAENPRYRILFGPVSISSQYQSVSRELMVSFLERDALLKDWVGLVATRNPFRFGRERASGGLPAGFDLDDLSDVISDVEPSRSGVPVLLRQYLNLGGKLLGFNVDRNFSNALDGLIVVDLTKTQPKLLARYLGKCEATRFLAFQKGTYGVQ